VTVVTANATPSGLLLDILLVVIFLVVVVARHGFVFLVVAQLSPRLDPTAVIKQIPQRGGKGGLKMHG
jgi:hypothetical protein